MGKALEVYDSSEWVRILIRLPRDILTSVKCIAATRERTMNEQITGHTTHEFNEENTGE